MDGGSTVWADVLIAGAALGRLPPMEQVGPDRYVVANSWPKPRASGPSGGGGFSGLAAASAAEPKVPRSSAGALALWPNLK